MKKLFYFVLLFSITRTCEAQNLVLNGDFELYSSCPTGLSQLDSALFWYRPADGTPDYYNQCSLANVGIPLNYGTYQYPKSGLGYGGGYVFHAFFSGVREYLEGTLSSPLSAGDCYHFEMYMNLSDFSQYNLSTIGAYFSDTLIINVPYYTPLPYIPQINNTLGNTPDTLEWILVSGNFTATGGESFFIIGNFNDDLTTDTSFYNPTGPNWTTYILYDDVSLTPCTGVDENTHTEIINIFPNPFENEINIKSVEKEPVEMTLYDIAARKLLTQTFEGSTSINTEQLTKGIYFYEVRNDKGVIKFGKIVKN